MSHTPGPWEWSTSNSWRRLRHSDRGVSTNVLYPCVHKDGQPDIEVSEDDALLIAAAPDLLAATRAYIDYCEPNLECEPILMRIRDQMRAAIAKATGNDTATCTERVRTEELA